MEPFVKRKQAEQRQRWAWIWLRQMARFHSKPPATTWRFTAADVVAFLRAKRDAQVPAWKRMRIIESMMVFRTEIQQQPVDDLVPL